METTNVVEFKTAIPLSSVKEGDPVAVLEYKEWQGDKYLIAQDPKDSSKRVVYRVDLELIENHELKTGGMFTILFKPAIKAKYVCALDAGTKKLGG